MSYAKKLPTIKIKITKGTNYIIPYNYKKETYS